MKLAKTPAKNAVLKTKSPNLKIVAAKTIGVESKNEYLATASLFIPRSLPVVIVMPDLETPGIKANACEHPIINVCLKFMFS